MVGYAPKRGDIVWLEFDPQKGKEIQKTRPALVISPYEYNVKTGLALLMPIIRIKNGLDELRRMQSVFHHQSFYMRRVCAKAKHYL